MHAHTHTRTHPPTRAHTHTQQLLVFLVPRGCLTTLFLTANVIKLKRTFLWILHVKRTAYARSYNYRVILKKIRVHKIKWLHFLNGMLYGYKFTIMKKCTSRKMQHRHTFRFLFVRGLTTVLLVGGLGVEDQENGLRQFPLLLHVIPFRWDLAKKEINRSKPRTFDEQEQSIRDSFLFLFLSTP